MRLEREVRPSGGETEGQLSTSANGSQSTTVPSDLPLLARRHKYGIYVLAERIDGRVVGQVYTSLPPAERKVQRAHERGLQAALVLVELRPVGLTVDTSVVPSAAVLLLGDEDGGLR